MTEIATLAGGCFWCTEAIFQRLKGVSSVKPGYAGGQVRHPSYEQVCEGNTGHAESIQIEFDPAQISFADLLDIFWHTHNPTTINQQGNDVGPQYRSVIFYHDEKQKQIAEKSKSELAKSGTFQQSIVTEITPFTNFYEAENYHHDYYQKHQTASYCDFVITPKIQALLRRYHMQIKAEYLEE